MLDQSLVRTGYDATRILLVYTQVPIPCWTIEHSNPAVRALNMVVYRLCAGVRAITYERDMQDSARPAT